MSFPQKLRVLRTEHNMTQAELGKRIHVARATIAGYERRDRQPSHEKLLAIADTFHVTIDYLLDADGDEAAAEITLPPKRQPEEKVFALYRKLSPRSQNDAYQYLLFLEERDRSAGSDSSKF